MLLQLLHSNLWRIPGRIHHQAGANRMILVEHLGKVSPAITLEWLHCESTLANYQLILLNSSSFNQYLRYNVKLVILSISRCFSMSFCFLHHNRSFFSFVGIENDQLKGIITSFKLVFQLYDLTDVFRGLSTMGLKGKLSGDIGELSELRSL